MATVDDYGFVLDGWRPACGGDARVGWRRIVYLGLDYIEFRVDVGGLAVTCRVDPCDTEATAPYAAMVRADLDHEIGKALRAGAIQTGV